MKRLLFFLSALVLGVVTEAAPFRFALLTDIHISPTNPAPLEDLKRSIDEIVAMPDLSFVLVSGDVTEAGDSASLQHVKHQLDRLAIPYYATSGNHETTWSESGCMAFSRVFGSDRFAFSYQGIRFLGFNSGPTLKMMDGHVSPQDIHWLRDQLTAFAQHAGNPNADSAVILVTHYPLQPGDVDNWSEVTDLVRQYDVRCIIGGHYHRNLLFSADGIPDVLCRSNLRGKDEVGGFTIISIDSDSIRFAEKRIGSAPSAWLTLPFAPKHYGEPDPAIRPSYQVNSEYPYVRPQWQFDARAGIYEAPTCDGRSVYFGDDFGVFHCLSLRNGRQQWQFATASRIKCAPAVKQGKVVFGSTDGAIYCLSTSTGKLIWKKQTSAAVMGCPVIVPIAGEEAVLIGGSDRTFRALSLQTGREIWHFNGLGGYVVSRPCVYDNKVIFGAWDCYLYALNLQDGSLCWKWSNGKSSDKFSPAAVWPVAANGRVYIVAPDRVFSCIDAATGKTIYRTAEHKVRESIGISADGATIYSRCMWDSVVAMDALSPEPRTIWCINAGYDYDHNPSMMVHADEVLLFGTKNGLFYAIAGRDMVYRHKQVKAGTILWKHKLGNSVINTAVPLSSTRVVVTSTDGRVTCLQVK